MVGSRDRITRRQASVNRIAPRPWSASDLLANFFACRLLRERAAGSSTRLRSRWRRSTSRTGRRLDCRSVRARRLPGVRSAHGHSRAEQWQAGRCAGRGGRCNAMGLHGPRREAGRLRPSKAKASGSAEKGARTARVATGGSGIAGSRPHHTGRNLGAGSGFDASRQSLCLSASPAVLLPAGSAPTPGSLNRSLIMPRERRIRFWSIDTPWLCFRREAFGRRGRAPVRRGKGRRSLRPEKQR